MGKAPVQERVQIKGDPRRWGEWDDREAEESIWDRGQVLLVGEG